MFNNKALRRQKKPFVLAQGNDIMKGLRHDA